MCGIREQYCLERAQGKGDGFQKLTCASTALDSKSEIDHAGCFSPMADLESKSFISKEQRHESKKWY